MKFLYLDCAGGASGDMLLGAFLDSLVPQDYLEKELQKLKLKHYTLTTRDVERHHIHAKKVDITVSEKKHPHRTLADIEKILDKSNLSDFVKNHSKAIFRRLAEAEAQVHRKTPEAVHFHEVGALDAIIDIVGTVICIERLSFRIQSIGYGAGSKSFDDIPNYLRIWQGQLDVQSIKEIAIQIETNIDDLNPEVYPYLAEQLYQAGAQDVSFYPAIMKKGRPGVLVTIIAQPPLLTSLKEILFRETTTIGLRFHYIFREKLDREFVTVETEWGAVKAKKVTIDGETRIYPEFEECKRIARISGKPLIEIQQQILQIFHQTHARSND